MLFAILTLTACVSTGSSVSSKTSFKGKSVSFESEKGSLSITNDTNKDVVILVGRLERNLVIGGIRAGEARMFNLSKLPNIPKKCSLLVRIIPYEVYRKKGRADKEDVVYTRLVVHDSTSRKSEVFFNIPKQIDMEQKHCVYISNPSRFVLELKCDDPIQGPVVATLLPGMHNQRIFLSPPQSYMPYAVFPTFIYTDQKAGEIIAISALYHDEMQILPKPIGSNHEMLEFGRPREDAISYNVAFIHLQNATDEFIEFRNAECPLAHNKGAFGTLKGEADIYEIGVNSNEGEVYSTLEFEFNGGRRLFLSPYKFKRGYEYNITVSRINDKFQYKIEEIGKKKSVIEDAKIEFFMED